MNTVLEATLKDILYMIEPSTEDWRRRANIIEELQAVVNSVESLRGATVEPFGSFVSNLFTRSGDLDVSILLLNGKHICFAGKKRKQSLLADVLQALRQTGVYQKLQFIQKAKVPFLDSEKAKVPILKFETRRHTISCDLSIDNLHGQMKSKLLCWITGVDSRFRDLVLLVKEWAKAHNINNPKTGSLNSYSLSLLVIFHFQTCAPPILPPLEEIYPGNVAEDLTGVRTEAEEHITKICVANIDKYKTNRHRSLNKSCVSELFTSFLIKFSNLNTLASRFGICTFTGKWEEINSNMRWLPKTYALFIEDPFERPENSARGVSSGNLVRISEAFYSTYCMLVSPVLDGRYLLGKLARPQIVNSLLEMQAGNSSFGSGTKRITHLQTTVPHASPQNPPFRVLTESERTGTHPNGFNRNTDEKYAGRRTKQRVESLPNLTNRTSLRIPVQQQWRAKPDTSKAS